MVFKSDYAIFRRFCGIIANFGVGLSVVSRAEILKNALSNHSNFYALYAQGSRRDRPFAFNCKESPSTAGTALRIGQWGKGQYYIYASPLLSAMLYVAIL